MSRLLACLAALQILAGAPAGATALGDALFTDERREQFRLSPDGLRLAWVVRDAEAQRVVVKDLDSGAHRSVFSTADISSDEKVLARLEWVDDRHLFAEVYELTNGVAALRDTRNRRHQLVLGTTPDAPVRELRSRGQVIGTLPLDPGHLLFAVSATTSYAYRVDVTALGVRGVPRRKTDAIDGGQLSRANRVAQVEGWVLDWLAGPDGVVRSVMYWDPEAGVHLATREGNDAEWSIARTWRSERRWGDSRRSHNDQFEADFDLADYRLLALAPGSQTFIVLTEGDDGRQAVQRLDVSTGELELIYQHPTAEILSVQYDYGNHELLSASYFEGGYIRQHYFQDEPAAVAAAMRDRYPNYQAVVAGSNINGDRYGVLLYANDAPGRLVVWDRIRERELAALAIIPAIDGRVLAPGSSGTLSVDGVAIEYFLTQPGTDVAAPIVVYPHGGPFGVHDDRSFDPAVQYLAAAGIAVLQVNFRGSSGYGRAFIEAGKGEFGRRMLDDIEAALAAAAAKPGVDGDRVCLLGDSYGGYAALMLTLRAPARYRCVAVFAAVTDLGLLFGSFDNDERAAVLDLFLPADEQGDAAMNHALLQTLSPLYGLDALQVPVLLTHGVEDRRVDVEHAWRLEMLLAAAGKAHEVHYYPEQSHGFDSAAAYREHMDRVLAFLERHLR